MHGGNCAAYFAGSCAALCSAASFAASVEGLPKTLASITYCIIRRPSVAPSNISILPQSRHLHFHSFSLSCPVVLPFALLSSSATIRTLTGCSTQKSEEEKEEQKKSSRTKKKKKKTDMRSKAHDRYREYFGDEHLSPKYMSKPQFMDQCEFGGLYAPTRKTLIYGVEPLSAVR